MVYQQTPLVLNNAHSEEALNKILMILYRLQSAVHVTDKSLGAINTIRGVEPEDVLREIANLFQIELTTNPKENHQVVMAGLEAFFQRLLQLEMNLHGRQLNSD